MQNKDKAPVKLAVEEGSAGTCLHTSDNDGHCHFCGMVVNADFARFYEGATK